MKLSNKLAGQRKSSGKPLFYPCHFRSYELRQDQDSNLKPYRGWILISPSIRTTFMLSRHLSPYAFASTFPDRSASHGNRRPRICKLQARCNTDIKKKLPLRVRFDFVHLIRDYCERAALTRACAIRLPPYTLRPHSHIHYTISISFVN